VQEKESAKRGVLRPTWQELLPLPQSGDTLKFWKSDRWGRSGEVTEFNLRLPVQADLTDIEAIVHVQGVLAATFDSPASAVLDQLGKTVASYISDACSILISLWRDRRADPSLLAQSPKQWKQPASLIAPAAFRGFLGLRSTPTAVTSLGVSPEGERRYLSAGIRPGVGDVRPDSSVWR
jgi:hypothetical protein